MRTPGEVIGIVIIAVLLTLTIVGALTGSSLLDGGSDPCGYKGYSC